MTHIAVLLTVFNRKDKTLLCLKNLFAQSLTADCYLDVFLTNDGCTDGTPEAVRATYPQVNVIDAAGNLFWNRGMYTAWKAASAAHDYDFYVWLNDDTFIYDNALQCLLASAQKTNEKAIIVGTTCKVGDPAIVTYGGRAKGIGLLHPNGNLQRCDYFNGNIVLFPKHVYERVGMNDPVFRHALGDFDYGLRASKHGIESYIAPTILGECDEHESLSTWCNPDKPFSKRWKAFRSPLGQNPEEFFIYKMRHHGFCSALVSYITNHLRVFVPSLWKKSNLIKTDTYHD